MDSKDRKDRKDRPVRDDDRARGKRRRAHEDPREQMNELIAHLRDNPKAYTRVRERFMAADSDQERVDMLIDFATSDDQLMALIPDELVRGRPGGPDELAATWTTVTVTTVTIPDTAY